MEPSTTCCNPEMAPVGFSVVILNLQIKTTSSQVINDVSHLGICICLSQSLICLLNVFSDISHRNVKRR